MRLPSVEKTSVRDVAISWGQDERDGFFWRIHLKFTRRVMARFSKLLLEPSGVIVLKDFNMHVDVHSDGPACSFLKEMDCLDFAQRIQEKSRRALVSGPGLNIPSFQGTPV